MSFKSKAQAAEGPRGRRTRLLFVGAFPEPGSGVLGGNVSDCRSLMSSSFPDRLDLLLLDTTQKTVPPPPAALRAWYAVGRVARFLWTVERERPDAMLILSSTGASFVEKALMAAYGRLRGVPALLSVRSGHFIDHCARSPRFRRLVAALLPHARLLVCQGRVWQRFFRDTFGISEERCPVVDAWVATDEYLAVGRERRLRPGEPVQVLFMGWMERFKGIFELLEAARDLRADPAVPPFRVVLAGKGNALDEARAWATAQGLDDVVSFPGWVDGDEKREAYRRADAFVLASYTEGLPNSMIEAMAAGLPVVVTPVGSIPDVVTSGAEGLLVPPRDAAALREALRTLLVDDAARTAMGRAAHRAAVARFTVERAAARLEELVQRALGAPRRPVREEEPAAVGAGA